jgi:hypothetical protein
LHRVEIPLCDTLTNVEKEEGHHESEETSSFSHSETQDGELEELWAQRRVSSDALDQSAEDGTDTSTSTSETNGGHTSALNLGGGNHGSGGCLGDNTAGLHGIADEVAGKGGAGRATQNQAVGGLGAAESGDGALQAGRT